MKGGKNCMNDNMMDAVIFMDERINEEDVNRLFTILLQQKELTDSIIKWLKFCMYAGADATLLDNEVLIKASEIEDDELLLLTLKGADPNARNGLALLKALKYHMIKNIESLYNAGAKITPEFIKQMIQTNDKEVFELLERLGVNIPDIYPNAIVDAAAYGNTEMFSSLFKKDPKHKLNYASALYDACANGYEDIAKMILPLEVISNSARTHALAGAISKSQTDIILLFKAFPECLVLGHFTLSAKYADIKTCQLLVSLLLEPKARFDFPKLLEFIQDIPDKTYRNIYEYLLEQSAK